LLIHKVTATFQVLRPDGQQSAISRLEIFRGNLPGQEWYVYVEMRLVEWRLTSRRGDFQVPVIAVFTKFDQFRRNIRMKLEDEGRDQETDLNAEVETFFNQRYLASLTEPPPFIRLESEDYGVVNS
jgi:hypothetical protein